MSEYTYYRSNTGSIKDTDTGIIVDVDILVQCPEGYAADKRALNEAVDRAVDYIFDEGLMDE